MKNSWKICFLTLIMLVCAASAAYAGRTTPNGGLQNRYLASGPIKSVARNADSDAPTITEVVFDPAVPSIQEPFTVTANTNLSDLSGYTFKFIVGPRKLGSWTVYSDISFPSQSSNVFNVEKTMSFTDMPGEDESYFYFVYMYDSSGKRVAVSQGYMSVQNPKNVKQSADYVKEIVAANRKDSKYETALALHDWVVEHCYYDESLIRHGAGHLFVYGTGVCDSYAKAYMMLLEEAGIECERVLNDNHAWNAVKLGGKWYQVDATWDDPGRSTSAVSGEENHIYFMVPDKYIASDHSKPYKLPGSCDSFDRLFYLTYPDREDGKGSLSGWISGNRIEEKISAKLGSGHMSFECDPLDDTYWFFKNGTQILSSLKHDFVYDMCVRYLNAHQNFEYDGQKVITTLKYDFSANVISGTSGHIPEVLEAVPPTCEETGLSEGTKCSMCDEVLTEQTEIPATGHSWGEASYEWAEDSSSVTAKRVCGNDGSHVDSETAQTSASVVTEAGCETVGETCYTASFAGEGFAGQSRTVADIPAKGHDWGQASYDWTEDLSSVTASCVCQRNGEHTLSETAETASAVSKEAGCEEKGETTYTVAFTKEQFTPQSMTVANIDPVGHLWGEAGYEWSEDDSHVTATRVCARDGAHVETETVEAALTVTVPATPESEGAGTRSAVFTNSEFQPQTKEVVLPKITPTPEPTAEPTPEPTKEPTAEPTIAPTAAPTAEPTKAPTAAPTTAPTAVPTAKPTAAPTAVPTVKPTAAPTAAPTVAPTVTPVPGPKAGTSINSGGAKYTVTAPGEVSYTGPEKSAANVTVPDTIEYDGIRLKVTRIDNNAFAKDKKLKKITIGANIEEIGSGAFRKCVKLTTVAGGGSVRIIENGAFNGCKLLKKVPVMPELESIGANAFKGCVKLTKFTLGEKVVSIGKNAFGGCKALKKLIVQTEELTSQTIGKNAFKGINSKAVIKCPKELLKSYKKLFVKKGAPKGCKFKK